MITADRLISGPRPAADPGSARLYVGTYTTGKGEGIYHCRFDGGGGTLTIETATKGVVNPSYLDIDRDRARLFSVNETAEFEGKPGGSVSAFRLDPETGQLRLLNRRSTHGADPCHLTVDAAGRFVLVANYTGGNLAVLPVLPDGSLGEATDVVQHKGSSLTRRQQGPHAHSVVIDPSGRFVYAADLGLDKLMIYRLDDQKGALLPSTPASASLKPGAGPRHLVFSPDGGRVYVANELDSTLTSFAVDRSRGGLQEMESVSTLPSGFSGDNFPADIHISRSGRSLYVSNRGHDSIAVFDVDSKSGNVTPVQHVPTGGKWPRNFTLDPTGRFLLVGNQRSDSIVVFAIHQETGRLTPTGTALAVPSPVCLKFL